MFYQRREKIFEDVWLALHIYSKARGIVADEPGKVAGSSKPVDVGSEPHPLNRSANRNHPPLDQLDTACRSTVVGPVRLYARVYRGGRRTAMSGPTRNF